MNKLIETISLLRRKYHFNGYIHVKAIPGASNYLLKKLGSLVDRMSANIELPTSCGLKLLAPNKNHQKVTDIMQTIKENKSKNFVNAGQSTQMIIGATKESDYNILKMSSNLYDKYHLKRVFYSAYVSVNKDNYLPTLKLPPLKREHRLYQADFLFRYYNFKVDELLDENHPNFNILLDPKVTWALRNLNRFPLEVNKANYYELLKVPGIGPTSAKKIISNRRYYTLEYNDLKKLGVVLKRAKYFLLCNGKYFMNKKYFTKNFIETNLLLEDEESKNIKKVQLSLFNE